MLLTYLEWIWAGVAAVMTAITLALLIFTRRVAVEAKALRRHVAAADMSARIHGSLLDVSPTLVIALDGMHRYVTVNRAFEEAVGEPREQLLGQKVGVGDGPLGAQLESYATRCAAEGGPVTGIVQFPTADKRTVEALLIMQPFQPVDSERVGTLAALVDITERLAAEREAAVIKRTVDDLVAALPMAFFRIRQEIGGHRWFSFMIGQTERFLRMSASEIRQFGSSGNLPNLLETQWDAAREAIEHSRIHSTPVLVDLESHQKDGTGWVRVGTGTPRTLADGVVEWSGYLADVTQEHRSAEALSLAKMKAESNEQAKARFLAAMSHEIRTPLATAVGALELLHDTSLDETQRQHVELAESSARLLIEILGDILDFSRLDAGQLAVETIDFDLRELLDQVLHIFSGNAREKGLTLDLTIDAGTAAVFRGDPVRVKQIVLNLVGNAIKFTAQGGVAVAVRADACEPGQSMQSVSIQVADTGIGISADVQRRLFTPFTQADASTVRQYGGSGLGLAICQRLASLLGGAITMSSAEGAGSVFLVRIPLHVQQASKPAQGLAGKRVAIAARRNLDQECLAGFALALGMIPVAGDQRADFLVGDADGSISSDGEGGLELKSWEGDDPQHPQPAQLLSRGPIRWGEFQRACLLVACCGTVADVHADSAPVTAAGIRTRVLVVEDHLPYQIVIRSMLDKLGIASDVVSSGIEALQQLDQERYAMMITDCHMPDMDGFELTRRVRTHDQKRLHEMPIVALSADVSTERAQRYRNAGLNDFLVKPVNLSTLKQCIEKWTAGLK